MNYIEYVVKKGDSLYEISKKYNVSVDELMRFNNLVSNMIYPNQVIYIPLKKNDTNDFYIIKKYDTLDSIAKKLNINLEDLLKYNNFEKLFLEENQKIFLNSTREHVIKYDDNLNTILKKYNLSIDELVDLNKNDWIRAGKIVKIK